MISMTSGQHINEFNFSEQEFHDVIFSNKINHLKISHIKFYDCKFIKCNFSNAIFEKCRFVDCEFIDSNLSSADFYLSTFHQVAFERSKLIGINWTRAMWPQIALDSPISFYDCNISDSSFYELALPSLILESCIVCDADFRLCNLVRSIFCGSDFEGAIFGNTNLKLADFRDAKNYSISIHENEIKKAKFSVPDVFSLLETLDIEISNI